MADAHHVPQEFAMESDDTDGARLIVKGRRWRRSDPRIPPPLGAERVRELMAARRAVRDAANERHGATFCPSEETTTGVLSCRLGKPSARSADRHAA